MILCLFIFKILLIFQNKFPSRAGLLQLQLLWWRGDFTRGCTNRLKRRTGLLYLQQLYWKGNFSRCHLYIWRTWWNSFFITTVKAAGALPSFKSGHSSRAPAALSVLCLGHRELFPGFATSVHHLPIQPNGRQVEWEEWLWRGRQSPMIDIVTRSTH